MSHDYSAAFRPTTTLTLCGQMDSFIIRFNPDEQSIAFLQYKKPSPSQDSDDTSPLFSSGQLRNLDPAYQFQLCHITHHIPEST